MNNSRRPQLNALTGIRFFAALAVLLFHYGAAFSERIHAPHAVSNLLHNGYMGVSLFFVLSGFILALNYEGRLGNLSDWRNFMVARFARIYPVYLLALLLALPVLTQPLNSSNAVSVLLMVQSWGQPASGDAYAWVMQAWTLSIEFFFYLMFLPAFYLIWRIPAKWVVPSIALVAAVIAYWGTSSVAPGIDDIPNMTAQWTPPLPTLRLGEFVFGILLCRWIRVAPVLTTDLSRGGLTLLTIIGILGWMAFASTRHMTAWTTILFGLLIVQLSRGDNSVTRFFSSRLLVLLGGASYALYILQGPIREWLRLLVGAPLDAALNPIVAIGMSVLVFRYFEEPARERIQAWSKRLTRKASTV